MARQRVWIVSAEESDGGSRAVRGFTTQNDAAVFRLACDAEKRRLIKWRDRQDEDADDFYNRAGRKRSRADRHLDATSARGTDYHVWSLPFGPRAQRTPTRSEP